MLNFLKKPTLAHSDRVEAAFNHYVGIGEACIFLLESDYTASDQSQSANGLRELVRHMRHNGNVAVSSSRATCEAILRDFDGAIRELQAMLVSLAAQYEAKAGRAFHRDMVETAKTEGWTARLDPAEQTKDILPDVSLKPDNRRSDPLSGEPINESTTVSQRVDTQLAMASDPSEETANALEMHEIAELSLMVKSRIGTFKEGPFKTKVDPGLWEVFDELEQNIAAISSYWKKDLPFPHPMPRKDFEVSSPQVLGHF